MAKNLIGIFMAIAWFIGCAICMRKSLDFFSDFLLGKILRKEAM